MNDDKKNQILWDLDDIENIKVYSHQNSFYHDLDAKTILEDAIYKPDKLCRISNHEKTKISNKEFRRVNFSKTKIQGISFHDCSFDQCLFISSNISDCEFHNCQFILTNTYKISITDTYLDPNCFKKCLRRNKDQNIGIHLYQMLRKNSRNAEQTEFARDADFLFLRWERYQYLYEIKKHNDLKNITKYVFKFVGRWAWELFLGSGIKVRYLAGTAILISLSFSLINFFFKEEFGLVYQNKLITSYLDAFYFTVVSLTTLGYGDITPTTECGKLVASLQSAFGFFLFAILASMLFRRISR